MSAADTPRRPDLLGLAHLLAAQDGVTSRRQLLALGLDDTDIERRLRRREWCRLDEGVYVDHTGPPTWRQRCWAAVLFYAPAALSKSSALQAHGLRGHQRPDGAAVQVCVDRSRSVHRRPGVLVDQLTGWEEKCALHLSPPRLRLEHAVLGAASDKPREVDALAVLADAVQEHRTTVDRLLLALGDRPRLRHRRLLTEILRDVEAGAYSVLERRYLVTVERAHGLPGGRRQRRVRNGVAPAYRDVDYVEHGTVVELNGRLGHEAAVDRWADLERDLLSVVAGDLTLRAGWAQVLDACRLALLVSRVLQARGWSGRPRPCCDGCAVRAGIPGPDAGKSAQISPASP